MRKDSNNRIGRYSFLFFLLLILLMLYLFSQGGKEEGSMTYKQFQTAVDGKKVESHHIDMTGDFDNEDPEDVEAIKDGYFHESYFRSAPSFDIRIDGITELTK